jgi:hypothetical protein
VQKNVTQVVTNYPKLLDFTHCTSSADAFLIATAILYNLIIITQERQNTPNKIPYISDKMGVQSININQLCKLENWIF